MYAMLYFDTEDSFSPPEHPVHQLPGQMADILEAHGLKGSFHVIGEKVRFMERHRQQKVIESIRRHDVSLHFDRGTVPPTTAEEISRLDWFRGVERALFRELPGIQTLERVFGKCSAITRHGATYAPQIAYAAGKMGKPFFSGPFHLPGRNIAWFCNNLSFATGEGGSFDNEYRDDAQFEVKLAAQAAHWQACMGNVDMVPFFGCHPLKTIMKDFPCYLNFPHGARLPREQWRAPDMVPGVSIETVLANFERRVKALAGLPDIEWTTVGDLAHLYGRRPVRVSDAVVTAAAQAVVEHGGPSWTDALSAGEILALLARRRLAPANVYDVPQIMGPVEACPERVQTFSQPADARAISLEITDHVYASGYLPEGLGATNGHLALECALWVLACDVMGIDPGHRQQAPATVDAIPGMAEACQNVALLKDWRNHSPRFDQQNLSKYFRWQGWTLKPAMPAGDYAEGIETGTHLNPAFPFVITN